MFDIECSLCESRHTHHIHRDETRLDHIRDYYQCRNCRLIIVPPEQRLSPEEEFQRYEMHENHPDDPEYRNFLSRMSKPLLERIPSGSYGLDFGSGPGPTLHIMLEEEGHKMELYDIFYADHPAVFRNKYDFITTTETVEHLSEPYTELNKLWNCLKPGGWLGIMTKRPGEIEDFKDWHYKNDDTHIIFFCDETFNWLGSQWGVLPDFISDDVVLFRKPDA